MAKIVKAVDRYKKKQAQLNESDRDEMESYQSVRRLKEINFNLEKKIERLYRMLGGENCELVQREKLCDEKAAKVVAAIKKLEQNKQEVQELVEKAYRKIAHLEKTERELLAKIKKLEQENKNLKEELHEEQRLNLQLEHRLRQLSGTTTNSDNEEFSNQDWYSQEDRETVVERKLDFLSKQFAQVQAALDEIRGAKATAPYSLDSDFGQIDSYLKG